MKIQRAKLDEVILDDEGKPFKDDQDAKVSYKKALRDTCRAVFFINGNGARAAFSEPYEDKKRLGMVAYKLQAKSQVKLDNKDVTLLKDRIEKLWDPVLIVRLDDVLEENASAEKRAAKENEEEDSPTPPKNDESRAAEARA